MLFSNITVTFVICIIATSTCTKCRCTTWRKAFNQFINTEVNILMKYIKRYVPAMAAEEKGFDRKTFNEQYNMGLKDDDVHLNITEQIVRDGYPVEQHTVKTADGYRLTIFRIPGNGSAVLIMHGLTSSADDWVTTGKDHALPFLLAEAGHDVWLGNARGTLHSRTHVCLSPDCPEFWDFSWDEIGRYDVPAIIDYILNLSNRKKLNYIGHSQGSTIFFVMCSEKPEYNKKISTMISLAAGAYFKNAKSPLVQIFGAASPILSSLTRAIGYQEITPQSELTRAIIDLACGTPDSARIICGNILFLLNGFDYPQLNVRYLPKFLTHIPAGSSIKQVLHYGQEILSGKFRQYDYGMLENLMKYGTLEPPDYPVEKVNARVVLFHGDNDWFSQMDDLKTLMSKLPNYELYRIPWSQFNHLDYLLAKDVKTLVYDKIMSYIN